MIFPIEEIANIGVPKGWHPDPVNNQVPFIPMAMVDQETGLDAQYEMRSVNEVRSGKVRFQTPAVLLAKITPSTENNKTSLITDLPTNGGYATTEVFAIHPKSSVEPKYLLYHLRTGRIRNELIGQMTGTSGRQRVPTDAVKNLKLVIPPKTQQLKVIERIEIAQSWAYQLKTELTEYLTKAESLFSAILERAFTGEFHPKIPQIILEQAEKRKAKEHKKQQEILAARRAAQAAQKEQPPMEKIEVNIAADLTRLLKQLTNNGQTQVSARELWQLSALNDIDTFTAYLSQEYEAGHIRERREGYQVYLEPEDETNTTVD